MNKNIVLAFWMFCFSFCVMTFFYCDSRGKDQDLPKEKIIKIGGSESELNLIRFFSNEFKKKNPDVRFDINGGGSGLGIHALLYGKVDIASASRPVNKAEIAKANLYGKRFSPIIIGLDVIAIVLNSSVGIDSLSLTQLGTIFDGTYKNWNQLGGMNIPIKVYGRNANSGTFQYIKERLLIEKYGKNIVSMNDNNELIDAVAKEKGAISYINLGSIQESTESLLKKVWVANINYQDSKAHSPFDKEAVKSNDYPLTRPLYQYFVNKPTGKLLELIQFELSDAQQKNLELHGYYPITPIHQSINDKSLGDSLSENLAK